MTKPLIIVESPTKIKTLKKYVGKEFNVAASAGHIRDLPVKTLGIDLDKNFKAEYVNIKDKSKVIATDIVGSNGVIHVIDSVLLP